MGKNGKASALFGLLKGKVSVEDLKKLEESDAKRGEAKMQRLLKMMGSKFPEN